MNEKKKHGVIRTDLMSGTKQPADLVSFRYMGAGSTATEIDNGNVVKLDGYMEGERELFKAVTPAADTPIDELAIVASVEIMYDERKKDLCEYVNAAGANVRGYIPRKRNIFSVTKEAIDGTPEKGNLVELQAGSTKMKAVASATGGTTTIGKVIDIEKHGRTTFYVIQVSAE